MNAQAFHVVEGYELFRSGPFTAAGKSSYRIINECRDGFVAALAAAGPVGGPMMRFIMDWADAEGVAHPLARDRDYSTLNFKDEPEEFFAAVRDTLAALFARHTKAELYQAALDHLLLRGAAVHRRRHPRRRAAGLPRVLRRRRPGRARTGGVGRAVGPLVGHAADDDRGGHRTSVSTTPKPRPVRRASTRRRTGAGRPRAAGARSTGCTSSTCRGSASAR